MVDIFSYVLPVIFDEDGNSFLQSFGSRELRFM